MSCNVLEGPRRELRRVVIAGRVQLVEDPDHLSSNAPQDILIEAGHGSFELLCAAQDPLPTSKIRSLQRLGIRLWSRAA